MKGSTTLGVVLYVMSILTTIPQIIKIIKENNSCQISFVFILYIFISSALWVYWSYYHDKKVALAGAIYTLFVLILTIVILKTRNTTEKNKCDAFN